jgi:hypothetical protein
MQLTVWVERVNEQMYRAETAQPVSLATEGRTRDEAVERLRKAAQERLATGEVIQLELPGVATPHPWVPFAGIWKDQPDIDALLDDIGAYRRELDEADSEA